MIPLQRSRFRVSSWLAAVCLTTSLPGCGGDDSDEPASNSKSDGSVEAEAGGVTVELDGGGDLPDAPNGAAACSQGACNYQTQSSCGSDQTCLPELSDGGVTPVCRAAGAGSEGAHCGSSSECARGLFCASGVCRTLCCGGDWSVCPAGQSCFRTLALRDPGSGTAVPSGASLCLPVNDCDVLDPAACASIAGTACQVVDAWGRVACVPEGQRKFGEGCSSGHACARGLICVGGSCQALCRATLGHGEPCDSVNENCVHLNRDPAGVGECLPK